jgi:hypothetical protein
VSAKFHRPIGARLNQSFAHLLKRRTRWRRIIEEQPTVRRRRSRVNRIRAGYEPLNHGVGRRLKLGGPPAEQSGPATFSAQNTVATWEVTLHLSAKLLRLKKGPHMAAAAKLRPRQVPKSKESMQVHGACTTEKWVHRDWTCSSALLRRSGKLKIFLKKYLTDQST